MKHNFYIGQNVLWHCVEYESDVYIKAVITEVHSDHCLAVSQNNGMHIEVFPFLFAILKLEIIDYATKSFFKESSYQFF